MTGEAQRIGDVLGGLLKRLGLERRVRESRIAHDWERLVGTKIARHSRPVALRGKVLIVHVDSSVWLSELSRFFSGEILARVREELGEKRVREVRFRIGEV